MHLCLSTFYNVRRSQQPVLPVECPNLPFKHGMDPLHACLLNRRRKPGLSIALQTTAAHPVSCVLRFELTPTAQAQAHRRKLRRARCRCSECQRVSHLHDSSRNVISIDA